jgi:glucuronokinase
MATGRAFPRAALLGNPSDGYGGATLAFCFDAFAAEVVAGPGAGVDPPNPLVEAAARRVGACMRLTWRTTIPRQVGLAGSSALVIATLRALEVDLEPDALAALALSIEVDDIGIAAGPQDRVAQAYEGVVFMDFASARHEPQDPALLPALYLAYDRAPGESSGIAHAALRSRGEEVSAAMEQLAALARAGRTALREGGDLGPLIDANFELRARLFPDVDRRAVDAARAAGASAHYAGSGGAIVGTCTDREAVTAALEPLGYAVLDPRIAPLYAR